MAVNTIQNPPPVDQPLTDKDSQKSTFEWSQWMDKFHYLNSTRNHQTITAANAINLDAQYIAIQEASGGYAVTLEPPTRPGIIKTIEMTARASGTVTLALTNVVGGSAGTTASFDAIGETLVLLSKINKWLVINEYGVTLS